MKNIIDRIKILISRTDFYTHKRIIVLLNILETKINKINKYIEERLKSLIIQILSLSLDENEDEIKKIDIEQKSLNEHLPKFSEIKNLIDYNKQNIFTKLIKNKIN